MKHHENEEVLRMALVGYETQRQQIIHKMGEIQERIGGKPVKSETSPRRMSAAARKRIGDAQRLRWKKFHQQKTQKAVA